MKSIGIGLAMCLAGCTSLSSPDPASPYYAYTTGWVAQLNRPLTIPAGAATVRLQYGRIVPRNDVQEHDPFCVVELDTVSAEPRTLRPGRFAIQRVTRSVSPLVVRKAASPYMKARFVFDDGDPTFLYYLTEFRLRDPAQPDLRGMRCAWNQMAPGNRALMRHLTLSDIHGALGGWMTLTPTGERL